MRVPRYIVREGVGLAVGRGLRWIRAVPVQQALRDGTALDERPQAVVGIGQVGLQHPADLRRHAGLLQGQLSGLQHLRVPAETVRGTELAVERPGPLVRTRGDHQRAPTEIEHLLVVPAVVRLAGLPVKRVEVRTVVSGRPGLGVVPQEHGDLADRPVEHARKLDHQVELRDAGFWNQPGGIAPHRARQLLPRTPLVPLRNLQQLLQALLSNGHDLGTEHAEVPSLPSTVD